MSIAGRRTVGKEGDQGGKEEEEGVREIGEEGEVRWGMRNESVDVR